MNLIIGNAAPIGNDNAGNTATDDKTVPAHLVQNLLNSAEKKGADVEKLVEGLNVCLDDELSQVNSRVSMRAYCRVLRRVAVHSQCHLFGLPVDASEPTTGLRLMCLALLSCSNMAAAIKCTADFYRNYGHPRWRFELERCNDDVIIHFTGREPEEKYAYDMAFLLRLWSWLSGQFIVTTEVRLTESRKDHRDNYRALFESDVLFRQQENMVRFHANHLYRPIVQTEESLTKLLEEAPYDLLVMSRHSLKSIKAKIRFIVGSDFTKGFPSREKLSEILHLSPSSLQRRLAEEGTSYQAIKDELRKDAAIRYLHHPELSVTATARLLGFEDSSAFNRTFKRWTGLPPGAYRKKNLETVLRV